VGFFKILPFFPYFFVSGISELMRKTLLVVTKVIFLLFFKVDMETEERNQRACKPSEPELFLQWGNRKRVRCVRVKDPEISARFRKITYRFASEKESSHLQPNRLTR
jgi:hypothetical protein